ncbi:hypothetical protein RBA41_04065 [Massilia sp. CCM 9210]|uniref:hypothetical protein n=1 Tax=Massilia scottii TaxID=3057166 RepID=UPI002796BA80|nr:hypothetical protein [Massilia sp. CCM 9210]MDQ1812473.1 hypothetical protein [Massilia sp. CCM 9210]
MGHIIFVGLHFLRRNLILFAIIVLILASGKWIGNEWRQLQALVAELPALRAAHHDVQELRAVRADAMTRQLKQFSGATIQQIDAQLREIDRQIAAAQLTQEQGSMPLAVLGGHASMLAQLRQQAIRAVELELLRQARHYLLSARAHALVLDNRQAATTKREQLRLAHIQVYAQLGRARQELTSIQTQSGWLAGIPGTAGYRQVRQLRIDIDRLLLANEQAFRDFRAQQSLLDRLTLPAGLTTFHFDEQRLDQAVAALRAPLLRAESLAARSLLWRGYQAALPVLPLALGVLIGWWLVPLCVRTLFYFVLAPLAARRPPIVLGPVAQAIPCAALRSAVSLTVVLAPRTEMRIRPDYCQSQPAGVAVRTTVLFDWRHIMTSMAAQLWMLKRLRAVDHAEVVVSSTRDALVELALLELPAGASFVLQPRALAGILFHPDQRPRIRSHWRLGTLHAWLSLQLRYLVFEGPATLIVKGCRGVRLEAAITGRSISQDATLGFSVHALYSTVRAEPFLPYLRGRQSLFHDHFRGVDVCYLYEEVPRHSRLDRGPRSALDVLADASLKAFGI